MELVKKVIKIFFAGKINQRSLTLSQNFSVSELVLTDFFCAGNPHKPVSDESKMERD